MESLKKILLLGSGRVVKTMVKYFLDTCHYHVTILSRNIKTAEALIKGKTNSQAFCWDADRDFKALESFIKKADLVVCMLPLAYDVAVAEACINCQKSCINTNGITHKFQSLNEAAKNAGIVLMAEAGAEPGIDHMLNQCLIDSIHKDGGKVLELCTLCGALPSMEFNNNPMLYKFSWSPMGLIMYSQAESRYLVEGKEIVIPAGKTMENHKLVDIEGVGTFEQYPDGEVAEDVEKYGLKKDGMSNYIGAIRYVGFCNTWKRFIDLGLLDYKEVLCFRGMSFPELIASQIHVKYEAGKTDMARELANYWSVPIYDDTIKKMAWLGLFDPQNIVLMEKGTRAEAMLSLLVPRLSIKGNESDWFLLYLYVVCQFPDHRKEKRIATVQLKGIPGEETAMCRSLSFTTGIIARLILEGNVKLTGVQIPTDPALYSSAIEELKSLGVAIELKTI